MSPLGISDIFRIPKFANYFYLSQRPAEEKLSNGLMSGPMVYIASYWQENSSKEIRVFSNCEEVELYLDDNLIAKQKPDQNSLTTHLINPPFTFSINEFVPGTIKAVGFLNEKDVVIHKVSTPEEPSKIKMDMDLCNIPISKNGLDYVFVYAKILDKNGTLCQVNEEEITFEIEGNAELVGYNPMKSEAGISTILLKTNQNSEKVKVWTSSKLLESDTLQINL